MSETLLGRLEKIQAAIEAMAEDPGPEPESSEAAGAELQAEVDQLKALANAAPTMLAALKDALQFICAEDEADFNEAAARAAIAKAEGRQ